MTNKDLIKANIEAVLEHIRSTGSNVKLIGVTKTVGAEEMEAAVESGLSEFGESKVQEALPKIELLNSRHKNLKFHFIGHLQTNKVNKAVSYFSMIQSVDSEKLASKISASAKASRKTVDALLEVKVSAEDTKFGIDPGKIKELAGKISGLDNIKIRGLMAMAPYFDNPEDSRPYFKMARKLFDEVKKADIKNTEMQVLSMGMTDDYKVAIEEGSNMVRIGRKIFGERDY